jgi:hypothetical protein
MNMTYFTITSEKLLTNFGKAALAGIISIRKIPEYFWRFSSFPESKHKKFSFFPFQVISPEVRFRDID